MPLDLCSNYDKCVGSTTYSKTFKETSTETALLLLTQDQNSFKHYTATANMMSIENNQQNCVLFLTQVQMVLKIKTVTE